MSKELKKIGFLFLFLHIIVQTHGQFIGYRIDDDKNKVCFKFEHINNLIIIPVTLNDSIPLHFILDTGVRTTLLTDDDESELDVAYNRPVTISGLGAVRDINAYIASNVSLKLPGITGRGQTLIVLGEDYLNLQSHIGKNVHGILGYDFFNHFVVKIEYDKKLITVYNKDSFTPGRKFTPHPITIESGRPYITAAFVQQNDTPISGQFLLDSGASHGLLLETFENPDIRIPEKNLQTVIGWGLGGEVAGKLGRLKTFSIGPFTFKRVLASFTTEMKSSSISNQIVRIGSIGGEILSRFTTIYDYNSQLIYLRKNFQFKRSFEYNLSGMDIVASGVEFKTFTVVFVVENSPAKEAGVKVGDVIVALNTKGAGELSLEEINGIFRSDTGQMMQIIVMRDNTFHSIKFRLKRII